ncbi:MAG: CHAT domain-containing tetratricopeptide repeat protein [Dermatophilaceae bacterium]
MSGALQQARDALRLVDIDPVESIALAREAGLVARQGGQFDAASAAERALGLAAIHMKDLGTATGHLREAISLGRRARSSRLVAEARMTLAFALNRQGRARAALTEISAALDALDAVGHAEGLAQRGAILQQLGRFDEAIADYHRALPTLRRADDLVWVQRVLSNRGVLHAFRYEFDAALQDLSEAEDLCQRLDLTLAAAFVQENMLLVQRRLGDVPRSLAHLGRAEKLYQSLGAPTGSLLLERSELMFSMRLFGEAREAAAQAVEEFRHTDRQLSVPEARLMLARAAVREGQADQAVHQVSVALREFDRQGRGEWVVLSRCELILVKYAAGMTKDLGVKRLVAAAAEAEAAGWPATAQEVQLLAGRLGLHGHHRDLALAQLELVSASRQRGTAQRRARGWLAKALLCTDAGDRRGATRAAARGLAVIEEHCRTIGATDLRASASGLGQDLAQLGLSHAIARGSPRALLLWAERGRARQLMAPPASPSEDAVVTQLLAQLRAVSADWQQASKEAGSTARFAQRQLSLERAIRDASRQSIGSPSGRPLAPPSPALLADRLGNGVLVEFLELDKRLYAVCVVEGRTSWCCLGGTGAVHERVTWLRVALARLSRQQTSQASAAAALSLIRHKGRELDEILFQPLRSRMGNRPVVVVPTGRLQSLPWSLLPTTADRPLTVSPSAALWHRSISRVPEPGHCAVIAGPALPGAHDEALGVASAYGVETPLVGRLATVAAVTGAIRGAALVHLAAHGTIRADNPLFSSLRMADGPLTVHDIERLDRGPDTVVLAACEAGHDVVLAGDEMLGLSASFLARETRHVVASVVPIPDAATTPVMERLHRLLSRGTQVAVALAQAQQQVDPHDLPAFAAAAGFVCFGAGFTSLAPLRRDPASALVGSRALAPLTG